MTESNFYPPLEPYDVFELDVGEGHRLAVDVSGNPQGRPAVVVHGGPGAGTVPSHRRFFDPSVYRIILVDQRGAGRSTPLGSVEHNTTQHLIADLERLRDRLNVECWLLFGGSWGSTLSLAYAAAYPQRVSAMILRGMWLGRPEDVAWHISGLRALMPDRWSAFAEHIPAEERDDVLEGYWRRLTSADPAVQLSAARAWCAYEHQLSTLVPKHDLPDMPDDRVVALARIEVHYFRNGCFLQPNALLSGLDNLRETPTLVVHGRYDLLARLECAWAVARALPNAELEIVEDAAHSAFEPGIIARLVSATDRFARLSRWK